MTILSSEKTSGETQRLRGCLQSLLVVTVEPEDSALSLRKILQAPQAPHGDREGPPVGEQGASLAIPGRLSQRYCMLAPQLHCGAAGSFLGFAKLGEKVADLKPQKLAPLIYLYLCIYYLRRWNPLWRKGFQPRKWTDGAGFRGSRVDR